MRFSRRSSHHNKRGTLRFGVAALLLSVALLYSYSCSKKNPVDSEPPKPSISALTLTPSHGAPGASIDIGGLIVDTAITSTYTIFFGETQSLISISPLGGVSTVAPLFFDAVTAWHAPPDSALDVSIFRNDTLVGEVKAAFISDSLIKAPGTTERVFTDLLDLGQALKEMVSSFPTTPGFEEQVFFAVAQAIDSYLVSEDFQGALDSLSAEPLALELVDAIYASAEFDETTSAITDAFQALATALAVPGNVNRRLSGSIIGDVELSKRMQVAGILQEYTQSFVHGNNVALGLINSGISAAGMLSSTLNRLLTLAGPITRALSAAGAVYAILDIVLTKIIVAALPTKLDSIVVIFDPGAESNLKVGDTTKTVKLIFASNEPVPITANDLISVFLSTAGVFVPSANTQRERILASVKTMLGFLKTGLVSYKNAHPDFAFDPDILDFNNGFTIPKIRSTASIEDTALVDFNVGSNSNVAQALPGQLEWKAIEPGSADVWIEARAVGESGIAIFPGVGIPLPYVYTGTTFGVIDTGEVPFSNKTRVTVSAKIFVEATLFPETVQEDSASQLVVSAGHLGPNGETVHEDGILIDIFVTGGVATPQSGVTGGLFSRVTSDIVANPGEDSVIIRIVATDNVVGSDGTFATTDTIIGADAISSIPAGDNGPILYRESNDETEFINNMNFRVAIPGVRGGARFDFPPPFDKARFVKSATPSTDRKYILLSGSHSYRWETGTYDRFDFGPLMSLAVNRGFSEFRPSKYYVMGKEANSANSPDSSTVIYTYDFMSFAVEKFATLDTNFSLFPRAFVPSPVADEFRIASHTSIFKVDSSGVVTTIFEKGGSDPSFRNLFWTSDGQEMIVSLASGPINDPAIGVIPKGGGQMRRFPLDTRTAVDFIQLQYRAASREVAYVGASNGILLLNIDNGSNRTVPTTSNSAILKFVLSRDGRFAAVSEAFKPGPSTFFRVIVVNLDTGEKQTVDGNFQWASGNLELMVW